MLDNAREIDGPCDAVHTLTGREVVAFIAKSHVGPDLEMKLFMLAP